MKKLSCLIICCTIVCISAFAQPSTHYNSYDVHDAYQLLYKRNPTPAENNPKLYGDWGNSNPTTQFNNLLENIKSYQAGIAAAGITFKFSTQTFAGNTVVEGIFQNGTQIAANLISQDGGNLVASGGGNIIASGGGNLVASGGGNLVASGGGNIVVSNSTPGASFGGAYTLASTGTKVIKLSPKVAMIIK